MNSPTHDPVEVLIASDAWCTRQILNICAVLPREQFHRSFDIGLGSLHATATHVVSTMRRWTDRLAGRTPRPMLHAVPGHPHVGGEDKDRTPEELSLLLDEAERDLASTMAELRRSHPAGGTLTLDWPGPEGRARRYTFTHGAVIAHVTTHGYHHRAQMLNMLRRLGAPVPGVTDGYPELSAVDWQAETQSPPVLV
ncbi:MAG: DinB family protein [Phycisphaerales bacterium]